MRRTRPRLALLALGLFVAACAETPTEPSPELPAAFAKGGNDVLVRGSGHIETSATRTFAFTARVDAAGNASGHSLLSLKTPVLGSEHPQLTRQTFDVTCVSVDGNRAWVAGTITQSTIPDRVGLQTGFSVRDGGQGKHAVDEVSLQSPGSLNPGYADQYCSLQPDVAMFPVEGGNVQVN